MGAVQVEARAVVLDVEGDQVFHVRERHGNDGRPGVLADVRQRLLGRSQQGYLRLLRKRAVLAGDIQFHADAYLL